jgi:orotidine-5'-phosphate decarboxylase
MGNESSNGRRDRLAVALDVDDLVVALRMARDVKPWFGVAKVGLELFTAAGPDVVGLLSDAGFKVFLDLKLHDIPNTVAAAMQAIHVLEPAIVTVHACGGRAMMEDAKAAAGAGTKVVAVTLLTSLDERDLASTGVNGSAREQVLRLTELARSAGLDGIVCSGQEVADVRALWPDGFLVVPGVRPDNGNAGDQKRTVTPRQARNDGASVLVIGRPISRAEDPLAAAREIEATL